jgi:hypothetical protein
MAGQQWFVRGGGKVYGPLDAARLKQLVSEGKINRQTDVAINAAGPWNPAGNVKGLFPASGSATKLPEPPPQGRVAQRAEDEPAVPPLAATGTVQRPENASGREPFRNWYRRKAGGWNIALQIVAWLCGGYVFFPLWWLLRENALMVKVGAAMWIGFVGLLAMAALMEVVDPEGMKKIREQRAEAAAERKKEREQNTQAAADAREKAKAEKPKKGELKGAHVAAGLVAFEMKNRGAVRPRGDVLNALARQAADKMDVPTERRDEFVSDFEWAFNRAWDQRR